MEYSNEDLAEELFREYSEANGGEFRADQVDQVIQILDDRYGLEEVDPEDVDLSEYQEEAIEIQVDGQEDSPVYSSPNHCVTHGNQTNAGGEEVPPEGPAIDNDGDVDQFGVR